VGIRLGTVSLESNKTQSIKACMQTTTSSNCEGHLSAISSCDESREASSFLSNLSKFQLNGSSGDVHLHLVVEKHLFLASDTDKGSFELG